MAELSHRIAKLETELRKLRARNKNLKRKKQHLILRVKRQDEYIRQLRAAKPAPTPAVPSEAQSQPRPSTVTEPKEAPPPTGAEYARQLLHDTKHPRLTAAQLRRLEQELMTATEDEIATLFPEDRLISNFVRNLWEWGRGSTTLTSLPWNISLPVSDVCNARCTFCTSWLDGKKQLTLEQLEKFEPVLRTAIYVGLVGHGEPLSHPDLGEIAQRLEQYLDPRAASYTITNGVYLAKWLNRIDQLRLSTISCSLNAATPQTHHTVMGFAPDEFPRIVDSLRVLASGQASTRPIQVSITLVVTQQNIHEIPAFVELGNSIGASSIYLRTLLPQPQLVAGLNYHQLPPYLHPDFERLRANAVDAMQASTIPVYGEPHTWGTPIFPEELARRIESTPPTFISRADALRSHEARERGQTAYRVSVVKFRGAPNDHPDLADTLKDASNPLNRHPPFRCRAVYNNLYVNELFLRVAPCCYLTKTPGHDEIRLMDMENIVEAWTPPRTGPALWSLRALP
jgi:sulfatase maturation enzyme AslB (radical SAM superfamily)